MSEKPQIKVPEVRQVPVWNASETIEMNGLEFQAIYEALASMQQAAMVMQTIISKNIMNEKIRLDFEKYDPETNSYVQMTDEEKAPHAEQVKVILESLRKQQEPAKDEAKVVSLKS